MWVLYGLNRLCSRPKAAPLRGVATAKTERPGARLQGSGRFEQYLRLKPSEQSYRILVRCYQDLLPLVITGVCWHDVCIHIVIHITISTYNYGYTCTHSHTCRRFLNPHSQISNTHPEAHSFLHSREYTYAHSRTSTLTNTWTPSIYTNTRPQTSAFADIPHTPTPTHTLTHTYTYINE